MQDSLWVKWIHEMYMKGGRWELFNAPITASWVIKNVYGVKKTLKDLMQNPKYSINVVYKDQMGTIDKVYWATAVWNRAVIPRRRFVVWFAYHERLKTKKRLKSMGVVEDDLCPICGTQPETTEHLFFKCNFSAQCTQALVNWMGVNWSIGELKDIL